MILRPSLFLILSSTLLSGCSWVGNYLAGKDNTEPPAKLTPVKSVFTVHRVWQRDTGRGSAELSLRLKPHLVGDRVFVVDLKGTVTALTASTGQVLWTTETKQAISSGPGANEHIVVVGTTQGRLVALKADSGKILWTAKLTSEILAPPIVAGNQVLARTIDGRITGMTLQNGQRLWSYARPTPVLTIRGNSMPVVHKGRVYVGWDDGYVTCLQADTGHVVWEKSMTQVRGRTELERLVDIDADPVIDNDVLYVTAYQGRLVAVNLASGQVLWERKMSAFKSITLDDRFIYVTDEHSHIWAFERQHGTLAWKQTELTARKLTGPTVIDGMLVVADYEGYIHWLSLKDGKIQGRNRGDSKGYLEAPLVHAKHVLVLGRSGTLSVFSTQKSKHAVSDE